MPLLLLKLPSETLDDVNGALTGAAFLNLRATCIELQAVDQPMAHPTLGHRFLSLRSISHSSLRDANWHLCQSNAAHHRGVLTIRHTLEGLPRHLVELRTKMCSPDWHHETHNWSTEMAVAFEDMLGKFEAALTASLCAIGEGSELQVEHRRLENEVERCERKHRRKRLEKHRKRLGNANAESGLGARWLAAIEDDAFQETLRIKADLTAQTEKLLALKATLQSVVTLYSLELFNPTMSPNERITPLEHHWIQFENP